MRALVTGATGFLGGALARRLKGLGWQVTALGRNPESLAKLERDDIRTVKAELANGPVIVEACRGQEIIFHCGALSSPWGKATDFYAANVAGTENVIRGAREHGVKRLVHVSTPSIYFGHEPRINVKEDAELPKKPANEYVRTKLMAESRIDEAFRGGLPVITIRPRAIFGPGDTALLPRLLDGLRKGDLPIIGDGKNLADLSFIDNVVDALLLCAGSPTRTLGRKYNITNGKPVILWNLIMRLADALGYACPKRRISYKSAQAFAGVLELIYGTLPGRPEPPLTRYTAGVLGASMTLDISAARGDLGYQPRISVEEGFDRVILWWKEAHR